MEKVAVLFCFFTSSFLISTGEDSESAKTIAAFMALRQKPRSQNFFLTLVKTPPTTPPQSRSASTTPTTPSLPTSPTSLTEATDIKNAWLALRDKKQNSSIGISSVN